MVVTNRSTIGTCLGLMVFAILIVSGCGGNESSEAAGGSSLQGDKVGIVASTSILGALAAEIGGDNVSVTELIGPEVDPHTFEITPGDVLQLADADLVFLNGLELDNHLVDDIEGANSDAPVTFVSDHVELIEIGGDHSDDHDIEDGHDDFDPHVWQDPLRVKIMVENIGDALAAFDPEHAETYRANVTRYQTTLDGTDAEIKALVAGIPEAHRKLITNHDSLGYFANRYGFDIIGTVIPGGTSESDVSAGQLAELTELIKDENVPAIFGEALLDPGIAEQLAEDAGIEIVYGLYTDQVGEPGSGAETVHGMLLANANKITEALS